MPSEQILEAILFYKSEPVKVSELAAYLGVEENELRMTAKGLKNNLKNRGIVLLETEDKLELRTAPGASDVIEKISKEELSKDLSRTALETLAIILYQGPISMAEIEYVRGVRSQSILRTLTIRGLVERRRDKKNGRMVYSSTMKLLGYLGISDVKELPEYENVAKTYSTLKASV